MGDWGGANQTPLVRGRRVIWLAGQGNSARLCAQSFPSARRPDSKAQDKGQPA